MCIFILFCGRSRGPCCNLPYEKKPGKSPGGQKKAARREHARKYKEIRAIYPGCNVFFLLILLVLWLLHSIKRGLGRYSCSPMMTALLRLLLWYAYFFVLCFPLVFDLPTHPRWGAAPPRGPRFSNDRGPARRRRRRRYPLQFGSFFAAKCRVRSVSDVISVLPLPSIVHTAQGKVRGFANTFYPLATHPSQKFSYRRPVRSLNHINPPPPTLYLSLIYCATVAGASATSTWASSRQGTCSATCSVALAEYLMRSAS